MIQAIEEIYATLKQITPQVYFDVVDNDVTGLVVVYEVYESGSKDAMNTANYASDIDLTVKILHPDYTTLYRTADDVKGYLLNQSFAHIKDVTFRNAVPIFKDYDMNTNQYTLNFTLYHDSTVQPITNLFMNMFFAVGASTTQNITITEDESGTYSQHTLTNISAASYTVNTLAASLPFSVVAGDVLGVSITLIDSTQTAKIQLEGRK